MAKHDFFYRRSFHSDRDLRGVESMVELEPPLPGRKPNACRRIHPNSDAGFEAPRNSLDVSIGGLLDLRRHGQVIRAEDIPIGYELSRSLTSTASRRRSGEEHLPLNPFRSNDLEQHLKAKSMARMHLEPGSQPRPRTSVVARLMGLDPLPSQESCNGSSRPFSVQDPLSSSSSSSSTTSSSQQKQQQKQQQQFGPSIHKQKRAVPLLNAPVEEDCSSYADRIGYGDLPFLRQHHPQEKQLEEFKREFASRHALRVVAGSKKDSSSRASPLGRDDEAEGQRSEELLDALDFLQANKELFSRVLNDPNSVFAKHIRDGDRDRDGRGSRCRRNLGGNLPRSFSESSSRKQNRSFLSASPSGSSSTSLLSSSRKKAEMMSRYGSMMMMTHTDAAPASYGADDAKNSATMPPDKGMGFNHPVPTRIVVLKPNIGKQAGFSSQTLSCSTSSSSSSSISLNSEDPIAKPRAKKDGKENNLLKQGKGIDRDRNAYHYHCSLSSSKDARQDAKDMARRIVEQAAKEGIKVKRESFSGSIRDGDVSIPASASAAASGGNGRRASPRMHSSSLPNSPRLYRNEATADQSNRAMAMSSNAHKGPPAAAAPSASSKEMLGHNLEAKPEGKLLRSLSAPNVDRTTPSSAIVSKPAEMSILKGRLLNLKESLLSTASKKKSSKKEKKMKKKKKEEEEEEKEQAEALLPELELRFAQRSGCELELARSENESSLITTPTSSHWDGTSLSFTHDDAESKVSSSSTSSASSLSSSADPSLNDTLSSDNGMTPKGLRRWVSAAAELADSTSDVGLDKCEQPSPISVLEMLPYQEESPVSDAKHPREDSLQTEDISDIGSGSTHASMHLLPAGNSLDEGLLASPHRMMMMMMMMMMSVDGLACPHGRRDELIYTRDVLAFGGFLEQEDALVMQCAFSSQHALDPALFDRLEDFYCEQKNRTSGRGSSLDRAARRLLFDTIDEILWAQVLKRPAADGSSKLPWLSQNSHSCFYYYTGKKLLEQVWAQLSYYYGRFAEPEMLDVEVTTKPSSSSSSSASSCSQEEDIAVMELWREPRAWAHGEDEVQSVAIELERLICADMIREFVREHRPRVTRRQENLLA